VKAEIRWSRSSRTATMDVPSPFAGTIEAVKVKLGDKVARAASS
jgi:biotin carboxyl carrier protein